jgi:hypothetical protein
VFPPRPKGVTVLEPKSHGATESQMLGIRKEENLATNRNLPNVPICGTGINRMYPLLARDPAKTLSTMPNANTLYPQGCHQQCKYWLRWWLKDVIYIRSELGELSERSRDR